MPKENINCIVMDGFRAEVSWRRAEYVCPDCETKWSPVTDGTPNYCPECNRQQVLPVTGHVQLATINPAKTAVMRNAGGADEPFDGWYVTLDQTAIERAVDALVRAGVAAFPGWKRDWSTDGDEAAVPATSAS